jgi:hypothetical protein
MISNVYVEHVEYHDDDDDESIDVSGSANQYGQYDDMHDQEECYEDEPWPTRLDIRWPLSLRYLQLDHLALHTEILEGWLDRTEIDFSVRELLINMRHLSHLEHIDIKRFQPDHSDEKSRVMLISLLLPLVPTNGGRLQRIGIHVGWPHECDFTLWDKTLPLLSQMSIISWHDVTFMNETVAFMKWFIDHVHRGSLPSLTTCYVHCVNYRYPHEHY